MIHDAIVIGGGITGAGVARDLAFRGLSVLLLERGRFGQSTTAGSSHLIHGGLRYLLYDRLTTHETCWDSGHIARIARPLLTRLPILWPVYRDQRRGIETVETLLESYDRFQPLKEGRPHLRLTAEETRRLMPGLKREGLRGGVLFDEFWVDAVALVNANIASAVGAGAKVREGARVDGLSASEDGGVQVRCLLLDGREEFLTAQTVVNAAGPWAGRVAAWAGADVPLRLQKGSHLVYRGPIAGASPHRPVGLILEAVDRERYIFILPGADRWLVGPTDLSGGEDPDRLTTTPEETAYLLSSAKRYWTDFPDRFDHTTVAARPILGQRGPEKLLSRGFKVIDHGAAGGLAGVLSVVGGKMSDFRLMGETAAFAVLRRRGEKAPVSVTDRTSLAGLPLAVESRGKPPSPRLKQFLDAHPRLREGHALAHLGAAFFAHSARRLVHRPRTVSAEFVRTYYE